MPSCPNSQSFLKSGSEKISNYFQATYLHTSEKALNIYFRNKKNAQHSRRHKFIKSYQAKKKRTYNKENKSKLPQCNDRIRIRNINANPSIVSL